jgi:hypothetical protein
MSTGDNPYASIINSKMSACLMSTDHGLYGGTVKQILKITSHVHCFIVIHTDVDNITFLCFGILNIGRNLWSVSLNHVSCWLYLLAMKI